MTPFKRSYVPESEIAAAVAGVAEKLRADPVTMRRQIGAGPEVPDSAILAEWERATRAAAADPIWLNDTYQVICRLFNGINNEPMVHLSIKRIDRQTIHDWRDLQEIKNQLLGPECEAIEMYPAESRVVDTANQYHLWGFTSPKVRVPIGFQPGGTTRSEVSLGKSVNRRFA